MFSICVCWIGVSVIQPYLAPWAESHGVSDVQVGSIFAAQPFAVVLVQPVSMLLVRSGHERLLVAGLTVSSGALALFAVTPLLAHEAKVGSDDEGRSVFLFGLLCAAGLVAGVGEGLVETSVYTLLQARFPDVLGQVTGHAEAWVGAGTIVGPVLGGALYSAVGFAAPPALVSVLLLALAGCCVIWARRGRLSGDANVMTTPRPRRHLSGATPNARRSRIASEEERFARVGVESCAAPVGESGRDSRNAEGPGGNQEEGGEERHLRDGWVFSVAAGGVILAGAIGGAIAPLISILYENDFGWSSQAVGMIFGGYGVVYVASSVVAGSLIDRGPRTLRAVFVFGALASALAICAAGWSGVWQPASVSGLLFLGVADGCLLVPGFSLLAQSAPSNREDLPAAVLNGCFGFGSGLGPLLTVSAAGKYGTSPVMMVLACCSTAFGLVAAVVLVLRPCPLSQGSAGR